ncbi:FAD-dependent oxidoreductase, partial [Intrasporangium sp.]|uniref:FAD-dependent oxidoreductase n=1 Tax=Intrasporangium sp. TaxID=1925024 RepID=UPI003464A938
MSARPVIVVGGGLAGITASLDLAGAGRQVLLLEARPPPRGRGPPPPGAGPPGGPGGP